MEEPRVLPALSRRGFLKAMGAGGTLVLLDAKGVFEGQSLSALTDDNGVLVTDLFRPEDQLRLRFEFVNLSFDAATNSLVATGTGTPLMRIGLPRQHVTEQPVNVGATPPGASSAPIDHRVAAFSRLVFEVTPPVPLDVASLLDFGSGSFTLLGTTAAGNPDDDTTMIEVPADLRWSPTPGTSVVADVAPITANDVTQLHRIVLDTVGGVTLFTPVFNASGVDGFARRIPNAGQRDAIVAAATTEGAAVADRLWLTPFGAWADIAREWTGVDWIQRVQGGRDQFVQVVERGLLLPLGVPAVVTSTVTRQWVADADGDVVAATIAEEHFAVSGSAAVEYPGTGAENDGRDFPFRSIRVEDQESFPAQRRQLTWTDPGNGLPRSIDSTVAWWVQRGPGTAYPGADVRLAYAGTDRAGNESARFRLPTVFVPISNLTPSVIDDLVDYFDSDEGVEARRTSFSGEVAWADPLMPDGRSSTLVTSELDLAFRPTTGGDAPIAPHVTRGVVSKPELTPPGAPADQVDIEVVWSPEFLVGGNDPDANPSAAFLDVVDPVSFPAGAEARAVMTPDFTAEEFNQTLGVGAKLDEPTPGAPVEWSPQDAFGEFAALLRGVKLADLVAPVLFDLAVSGIDIPAFTVVTLTDSITQTYEWCPNEIRPVENAGFLADADTSLCVRLVTVIALDLDLDASATIEFEARDFTLVVPPLVGLIEFDVRTLRAVAPSDGPADLTFDVDQWRLGGLLAWLEPLITSLVPSGSAFDIDITSTSIDTDLGVALPDFSLGVLELRNFALELSGQFPFVDDVEPRIEFAVGSRREPVGVQIMQFGGGFFCELAFNATGVVKIVVSAEVSARLFAVDVGVAEAYLAVGVGATFKWVGGDVTFIGELWVEITIDIFGFVSASVRVTARVKYKPSTEIVTFSGTIYWSVTAVFTWDGQVPIGSTDLAIGDGAGPAGFRSASRPAQASPVGVPAGSFGDAHDLPSWTDYVAKFAPET